MEENSCSFCQSVGFQNLELDPNGPSLDARFQPVESPVKERKKQKKREGKIRSFYNLGQHFIKSNIPELVKYLLDRDFKKLADYDGLNPIGSFFSPAGYVPKYPKVLDNDKMVLENQMISEDQQEKKHIQDLLKLQKDSAGDFTERNLRLALKSIFGDEWTSFIIQGLEMLEIDPEKRTQNDKQEIDYFVINHTLGYNLNIEAKTMLGTQNLPGKNESSTEIVTKQLKRIKNFFENWFKSDISSDWKYISMIYCEKIEEGLNICTDCDAFVAKGKEDFIAKLQKIHETISFKNSPNHEEFKLILRYLLYCSPVRALPIGGNLVRSVRKAMELATPLENMLIWCFPTPEQRNLLSLSHIIFLACWGTGKTLLMYWKALELAGKGEKVLFLIFHNQSECNRQGIKTFLTLDMERKFEHVKDNVTVTVVPYVYEINNDLVKITQDFDHLFLDEFFDNFINFNDTCKTEFLESISNKKTVWIAPSNSMDISNLTYGYDRMDESSLIDEWPDDPRKAMEDFLPDEFHILEMNKSLRTPMNIFEEIKEGNVQTLNYRLMQNSNNPPNLTDGCPVERIETSDVHGSLSLLLEKVFKRLPQNSVVTFVFYEQSLDLLQKEIQKRISCQSCKIYWLTLCFDYAFEKVGRKTPLYHTHLFSSNEPDLKDWIGGQNLHTSTPNVTSNTLRDVVTTQELVKGFEVETVMNFDCSDAISRSYSNGIQFGDDHLDYCDFFNPVVAFLNQPDHQCDTYENLLKRLCT